MSKINFTTPFHLLSSALLTVTHHTTNGGVVGPFKIGPSDVSAVLLSISQIDAEKVTGLTELQQASLGALASTIEEAVKMSKELLASGECTSNEFDMHDLTVHVDGVLLAKPIIDLDEDEDAPAQAEAAEPQDEANEQPEQPEQPEQSEPRGEMGMTIPELEEALQKTVGLLMLASIVGSMNAPQPKTEQKADTQPAAPEPNGLKVEIGSTQDEKVRASVERLAKELGLNATLKR